MKKLFVFLFAFVTTAHADAPPIKIGAVFSLSGWAAIGGKAELNAIQMAVSDINSTGGIAGRKLELVVEDNQSDLNRTVNAIQKLTSIDKVNIILGPNWAEFAEVAAPTCEGKKVIMLTASGYTKTLTHGKKYIFTTLPSHAMMIAPLTDYIVKSGFKKIALETSITSYFESISEAAKSQLQEHSITPQIDETWNPGQTDFRTHISNLKKANIDAVLVLLKEGGELAAFLRQAKELSLTAQIFASNALLYDHAIEESPGSAEGAIVFNLVTKGSDAFLERFKKEYGEAASDSVPRAYDLPFILKDSITRCGDESDTLKLAECIKNVDLKGESGRIRFDENHLVLPEGIESVVLKYHDGKAIPIEN